MDYRQTLREYSENSSYTNVRRKGLIRFELTLNFFLPEELNSGHNCIDSAIYKTFKTYLFNTMSIIRHFDLSCSGKLPIIFVRKNASFSSVGSMVHVFLLPWKHLQYTIGAMRDRVLFCSSELEILWKVALDISKQSSEQVFLVDPDSKINSKSPILTYHFDVTHVTYPMWLDEDDFVAMQNFGIYTQLFDHAAALEEAGLGVPETFGAQSSSEIDDSDDAGVWNIL